mmetsp:Transcript_78381/g.123486  ORF Transcript_78381/g.123486 Transcript_78381/m.123486 type:complete len:204 (-) Transcript_78381:85-696(-)
MQQVIPGEVGDGYLLPASTLTPAAHPLRSSLTRALERDSSAGFRSLGSMSKLPKSGSTRAETSPTSGRASEVTVVPLSGFDAETKVEWLQQELDRCEAQCRVAVETQKDLERRLERQRLNYEQERQRWQNDQELLQRRVAQLELEKRHLLQNLESLVQTLSPKASIAAQHLVRFLSVPRTGDENPVSPQSEASSVAQVLCGSE